MPRDELDRPVYMISIAAELAGVHPQTLRMYERRGLLRPQRSGGNVRRYSQRDVQRLRHIQDLTDAGLNLAGVHRVLAMEEQMAGMALEVERLQATLHETMEALRREAQRAQRSRYELVPVRPAAVVPLGRRRRRG